MCHAAKYPFAQPAISIASDNDEVGADVRGQANEIASIRLRGMHADFVLAAHTAFLAHRPAPKAWDGPSAA